MSPRRRRRRRDRKEQTVSEESFWKDLNLRIKRGEVIPIISNSARNDRIFDVDYDYDLGLSTGEADPHAEGLNVEEELAQEWAEEIGYPLLSDRHRLARVAVYNRVKSFDDQQAKTGYLRFLRQYLLDLAEEDQKVADLVADLREQADVLSFSEIACQLDYPSFKDVCDDTLRLLAKLPLPIYVTTSYYDFMERALQAEGKPSRTQICFLFGEPVGIAPEHCPDPSLVPTPEEPLVYHLHGLERYPESLVLSEDDYLEFLVRVSEESKESKAPLIPLYLSAALAESSLILLGYRLHDWDFRVVFRGLIKAKHISLRKFSLAIQLDPVEQREIANTEEARNYLKTYFEPEKFIVEWGTTDSFVKKLCQKWDEWRGCQA
jgi:hypothetical protein